MTKVCKRCGLEKAFEDFRPHKRIKDGRMNKCRLCVGIEHKARLRANAPACADCGEKVSNKRITRCRPCSQKHRSGQNHHAYKGGRSVSPRGYVYLSGYSGHPNARKGGGIAEHVLVMSQVLGRPLTKEENVHHKNGDRSDNRAENLELWNTSQPYGQRVEDKVAWATEILRQYKPEFLQEEAL